MFHHRILAALLLLSLHAVAQPPRKPAAPSPKPADDPQLYRNATFAFRYEIRYGWVDRTKDMREQQDDEKPQLNGEKAGAKNDVLLAIFERPPDAAGNTVNSAVVIATESADAFPGLKRADQYLGPLTEFAVAKGFKAEGDPVTIQIDGRELVRADFSKPLGEKVTMHQSTLVVLIKGQVVSFNFIAGTEDELDDLVNRLHFVPSKSTHH